MKGKGAVLKVPPNARRSCMERKSDCRFEHVLGNVCVELEE